MRKVIRVLIGIIFILFFLLLDHYMTKKAVNECVDGGNSYYFCINELR